MVADSPADDENPGQFQGDGYQLARYISAKDAFGENIDKDARKESEQEAMRVASEERQETKRHREHYGHHRVYAGCCLRALISTPRESAIFNLHHRCHRRHKNEEQPISLIDNQEDERDQHNNTQGSPPKHSSPTESTPRTGLARDRAPARYGCWITD